jgi:tetratricopeptide (TPR) repeat protein
MDASSSFRQAREWLQSGQIEPAHEMLQSLRRQFEGSEPSRELQLELWRGLLTVAQALSDGTMVQEVVPKLLQLGREMFEFESQQMGSLLHQAGQALAATGAGGDAETFFTQAYRRLPSATLAKHRYAQELGFFYALYGHHEFALRWVSEASLSAAELGPAERVLAARSAAAILDVTEKSLEAQAVRQQAMTVDPEESRGWLLVDQARGQRRLGWASKAEALYREALQHLPLAEQPRIWRELALTLLSRRDLAGADAALEAGLAVAQPVSFLGQLLRAEQARLYQFQGRFGDAERILLEVLASWEERYQAHHPICLRLREPLIELCILRRDFVAAMDRARKLLQIVADRYGSAHAGIARALFWMAQVFNYEGNRDGAKQALEQADIIWEDWVDLWEVERAQILFGLGLIFADELEFYRAEDEVRRACEMVEQGCSSKAVVLGHFLAGLSDIHRVTGRDRQSQEAAERSQELIRPKQ